MSRQEVEEYLKSGGYDILIKEAMEEAWEMWKKTNALLPFGSRTRANIVNDALCRGIEKRFQNLPGISIINNKPSFLVLNFENRLLMRFKKLDKGLHAKNIQTKQQKKYDQQYPLPGIPDEATRVVAGYLLDRHGASIKDMFITRPVRSVMHPVKGNIKWSFSFMLSEVEQIQQPVLIKEPEKRTKIRAKNSDKVTKKLGDTSEK